MTRLARRSDGAPPQALRDAVDPPGRADWQALGGGRSNLIWKVSGRDEPPFVVKLYDAGRGNALFPNAPEAEMAALAALAGTGLAPVLLGRIDVRGMTAVRYRFVEGKPAASDPVDVARRLDIFHARPVPRRLRGVPQGGAAIRDAGQSFADQLAKPAALPPPPEVAELPAEAPVFLHGDPVPANIIQTPAGPCFIDWQCPGSGDPCEDLAIHLSPAMRVLYGGSVLSADQVSGFLGAYRDGGQARRYRHLAPLFHWRMAAYCLWMGEAGARDYAAAAELELAALEQTA